MREGHGRAEIWLKVALPDFLHLYSHGNIYGIGQFKDCSSFVHKLLRQFSIPINAKRGTRLNNKTASGLRWLVSLLLASFR